ncbi:Ldh family oxidoreductase [endosymbiont of Ridgeia piscesae]|jgi:LDH2 family malate/lactate/ureidoglycolate dehydrogenase|uniref:Malate dehydrogenase (NAD) /L-sulfolactate dehydrogenase n=1 Tax=endosymbiont of Ridgeia piscesae TaxID=54398 RepID=A0A0T5Z1W3_9GAMM|nr:Ldh family oxidoreductase [endosymbiont of Ridgeia piscesae]KRT56584.1 Malate/lactate/ureidoglycolate dehydrogenase, LDH2 family [endosymbiont of Ridgeia piscesae]KRT56850.1 malate dehydrogenase (NAD) /L-sulfolactate dehydrogenase [endosymbiont of Ridgeia piscesae]
MSTITTDQLTAFAVDILTAAGADREQATSVAEVLIWGNSAGRPNQGVWRLPILCKRLSKGLFNSPCNLKIDKRTPSVAVIDGDNGIGHYVGQMAADTAIDLASKNGVGVVTVSDSNFLGSLGYYVDKIAKNGMLAVLWNNSFPKVAPYGGVKAVLGTNPLAFAAPRRNGRNVIADLSTGASAGSTITKAAELGQPIPEGIAIARDGTPITDPAKVKDGALLPFGGAKGYALGLMVEIMAGVVSGAGISHGVHSMYGDFENPGNSGHFFMAVDINTLMPMNTYYDRMEMLVDVLRESGEEVMLPGEGRWSALDKTEAAGGIALDEKTTKALTELANSLSVITPW